MEKVLLDILRELERTEALDERALTKLINRHNKRLRAEAQAKANGQGNVAQAEARDDTEHARTDAAEATSTAHAATHSNGAAKCRTGEGEPGPHGTTHTDTRPLSKRRLLACYLDVTRRNPQHWRALGVSAQAEERLLRTLRMKPRRTASGVATITVLAKPWKCSNDCLYCPNDLRMPKSYLADEPACQRAERSCFDPYLQVEARCRVLAEMGHVTDKVELIVLGGTWSDYPLGYRLWFMRELFAALSDGPELAAKKAAARRERYRSCGVSSDPDELAAQVRPLQEHVNARELSYNRAFDEHYGTSEAWQHATSWQTATWDELEAEHVRNEEAPRRVVGLVVETRPDRIDCARLAELRRMGCTKVQMGIQSLNTRVLEESGRHAEPSEVERALDLLRLFGFKTHVHTMANLPGSTPEADKTDYARLMTETPYQPDEVKLYPCVLVGGTGLQARFEAGAWQPYSEDTLVDVLAADVRVTPPFCRISRMIRDFSAPDIVAGNKKVNLRQLVEARLAEEQGPVVEIRSRELALGDAHAEALSLDVVPYETTSTSERFLQWVTPEGRIAGFLRLSLPRTSAVRALGDALPVRPGEAMIREVHVYGRVAGVGAHGAGGAQHQGLGTRLIEAACDLAREAGYVRINVISAVGTRAYYRKRGFVDAGLYQQRTL